LANKISAFVEEFHGVFKSFNMWIIIRLKRYRLTALGGYTIIITFQGCESNGAKAPKCIEGREQISSSGNASGLDLNVS
jgi:hypothetical protein